MAVAVEQDFPRHARWLVAGRMMLQEFAEQKGLPPQAFGACVGGEEPAKLVAEHGGAARFEHDNRTARVDRRTKRLQHTLQIHLGVVQETEVVQGSPAAEVLIGNGRAETCVPQDSERGLARLRVKVVVERVDPEDDVASTRRNAGPRSPSPEAHGRELREVTLCRKVED